MAENSEDNGNAIMDSNGERGKRSSALSFLIWGRYGALMGGLCGDGLTQIAIDFLF